MITSDTFNVKQLLGSAVVKLYSGAAYIVNDDDLDMADIMLLFIDGPEC
jgi:hypothetical protein